MVSNNPISILNEYCQRNEKCRVEYKELENEGVDHAPIFNIKCVFFTEEDEFVEHGSGITKKKAKIDVAQKMVDLLLELNNTFFALSEEVTYSIAGVENSLKDLWTDGIPAIIIIKQKNGDIQKLRSFTLI